MVVSDLLLTPEATPSSKAVSNELARARHMGWGRDPGS